MNIKIENLSLDEAKTLKAAIDDMYLALGVITKNWGGSIVIQFPANLEADLVAFVDGAKTMYKLLNK